MVSQPPFLYNSVRTESKTPYREFDPKAVSRASFQTTVPRPKQEGPLLSFNQHPDSHIRNYGISTVTPMGSSVKFWVNWTRRFQLVLRCLEAIASTGFLVLMIMIRHVEGLAGTVMRVTAGVAILHTVYGAYHVAGKASARTPGSSASYNLFAALLDLTIASIYGYSALYVKTKAASWTTILADPDGALVSKFIIVLFYTTVAGGGLYLISLIISIYLTFIFRKITQHPPDMNPLEDNLTSRHKRNKSSVSTTTTMAEKRLSIPLESKRSSGAAYEDLSRPPTIPFFHTRSGSTESFSTYKSTTPPSRDSRLDLPSRQYQIPPSPRSSIADMKRASYYGPPSPPKRGAYTEVPMSDTSSMRSSRQIAPQPRPNKTKQESWYARDSLPRSDPEDEQVPSASPHPGYKPIHKRNDSFEGANLPNPLEANPPVSRTQRHSYRPSRDSPLQEIINRSSESLDMDIVDSARERDTSPAESFRSKYYGELKPGTPPIMVGGSGRHVSSGTDFQNYGGHKIDRREVSGKVAEEGRSSGWGTRFRKVSGI